MVDGRSGPLGRCDALFDGPADPFAQVLNAVLRIDKVYQLSLGDDPGGIPTEDFIRGGRLYYLLGPALEPLGQFRQVGLFPADPEAPAQDVGHTLGTEFTLLPDAR